MNLTEVYESVVPSTIAFISKFVPGKPGDKPLMPIIIGTGFFIDRMGIAVTNRHVAEALQEIPPHPENGEPGYGAILLDMGKENDGKPYMHWLVPPIVSFGILNSFAADSGWYGEDRPDMAFIQFGVRDTPSLKLAIGDFYVRPGTLIATAGFPMGEIPLTIMGKVNQIAPFLRRGIVSSVYPFSIPKPHGLTIDILQQGGSSGSPIFYEDEPTVVGMMASGIRQPVRIMVGETPAVIPFPTNVSIAVPSHLIATAFASFLASEHFLDPSKFPTFAEWKAAMPMSGSLVWSEVAPPS
jgi:hypothetical protein